MVLLWTSPTCNTHTMHWLKQQPTIDNNTIYAAFNIWAVSAQLHGSDQWPTDMNLDCTVMIHTTLWSVYLLFVPLKLLLTVLWWMFSLSWFYYNRIKYRSSWHVWSSCTPWVGVSSIICKPSHTLLLHLLPKRSILQFNRSMIILLTCRHFYDYDLSSVSAHVFVCV